MKILQVISSFPPAYSYGGAARVAYDISKELVKKGHEVTVYTTDVFDANSRFKYNSNPMYMDGIEVYHFKNLSNNLSKRNFPIALEIFNHLKKNLQNFDIAHIHEYRSFQAIVTHHFTVKYGVPYVLQAHGSSLPFFQKQTLKKMFDFIVGYEILKNASKAIAITDTEREQLVKMGIDRAKIEIVPNGIDFSFYDNLPDQGLFKEKYGIGKNEKIILYLGRIHAIKGIDLLVDAFSDLVNKIENIRLVIAGPDDGFLSTLKAQIENLKIRDRILFTGPLYEMDKLRAYVDADVYVLPSVYEAFSVTVLEACACGIPVIVTDRCGIADFVSGRVGYVVKFDKYILQDAIFKILCNENLKKEFGLLGRDLVNEKFNWMNLVGRLELIYETIRIKDGKK